MSSNPDRDSNPDSADERMHQLYVDFASCLRAGISADLSGFDCEDLIDVFDYARTKTDDYVALEALIEALRRYRTNREVRQRLTVFFHDLDADDIAAPLSRRYLSPDDPIARAAAFRDIPPEKSFTDRELLQQLCPAAAEGSLTDNEVLYIIDALVDTGRLDAAERLAPQLSRLSCFPDTVYSELHRLATERGDNMSALAHLQSLTMLEPFSIAHWIDLASLQASLQDVPAATALESVEYALAIDPDSAEALLCKANIVLESDPREARNILSRLQRAEPDNLPLMLGQAQVDLVEGLLASGIEKLEEYAVEHARRRAGEAFPREFFDILFYYLSANESSLSRWQVEINRFVALSFGPEQAHEMSVWIAELFERGFHHAVVSLGQAVYWNDMLLRRMVISEPLSVEKICLSCRSVEGWDILTAIIEKIAGEGDGAEESTSRLPVDSPALAALYVEGLMHQGRGAEARRKARAYVEELETVITDTSNSLSLRMLARAVKTDISALAGML